MKGEALVYARRPDTTAIWLPPDVVESVGAREGEQLTPEQFNARAIQEVLAARRAAEGTKAKKE